MPFLCNSSFYVQAHRKISYYLLDRIEEIHCRIATTSHMGAHLCGGQLQILIQETVQDFYMFFAGFL